MGVNGDAPERWRKPTGIAVGAARRSPSSRRIWCYCGSARSIVPTRATDSPRGRQRATDLREPWGTTPRAHTRSPRMSAPWLRAGAASRDGCARRCRVPQAGTRITSQCAECDQIRLSLPEHSCDKQPARPWPSRSRRVALHQRAKHNRLRHVQGCWSEPRHQAADVLPRQRVAGFLRPRPRDEAGSRRVAPDRDTSWSREERVGQSRTRGQVGHRQSYAGS